MTYMNPHRIARPPLPLSVPASAAAPASPAGRLAVESGAAQGGVPTYTVKRNGPRAFPRSAITVGNATRITMQPRGGFVAVFK